MIKALMLKYETTTDSGINNQMRGKDPLEIILNAAETYNPDILLAPEFFLYNGGKPYSKKEKKEIEKMIAGRAGAENRLIIPGTIIWEGYWGIYNTAPIINGSNITNCHKATDGGTSHIGDRHGFGLRLGKEKGRIFKWRNLDLGLEICSDHSAGSLKQRKERADIHIIIGCGMRIFEPHSIAKDNGYVMLCDGSFYSETIGTPNIVNRKKDYTLRDIKHLIKTTTEELYELEL